MATDKSVRTRLNRTRKSAAERHKDFNLDFDYLRNILNQPVCAYSGEIFKSSGPDSLSLERWDNDKGYVKGNVIPVKAKYNHLRGCLTIDQLCVKGKIAKEHAAKLDRPETLKGKAKMQHDIKLKLEANLKGRVAQLEKLLALDESQLDEHKRVQLENLPRRIESSTEELRRVNVNLEKEMKKLKGSLRDQVKQTQSDAVSYGIIAKALLRFEYMNAHNYVRLKRGLPMIHKDY